MSKTVSLWGPGAPEPWKNLGECQLDLHTHQITTTKVLNEGTLYQVDGKRATVKTIKVGQYQVLWEK